jgi:tetratricopeptide (TPR) repeat protein
MRLNFNLFLCWTLIVGFSSVTYSSALTSNIYLSQDTSIVNSLNRLAKKYLATSTDTTLIFADSAASISRNINFLKGEANALEHMAQAYIYMGDNVKATVEAKKSLKIYQLLKDEVGSAVILNKMGAIHMNKGEYDIATDYLKESLQLLNGKGDLATQASTYNSLGNIAQKKGNYSQASEYIHKALNLNQQIGRTSGVADALNNLGVIYEYQEDYEKALSNYQESYLLYQKIGDKLGVAIGMHNAGIILKKTEKYDSAIYNFKSALVLDTEFGAFDGVAYDKKELGETYFLMNQLDSAYRCLHDALKLSITYQDPVVEVPALVVLGKVHKSLKDYDSALFYFHKAFVKSEESQLFNEKKEAAKALYLMYDQKGHIQEAYDYYKVYNQLKDTLFNEESIKKITLLAAEYEFEQSRKDDELQTKLNNIGKDQEVAEAIWLRNTSVVGIFLISLIAVMTYFNYRRKRFANEALNKLNLEVNAQKEELSQQTYELAQLNDQLHLLNGTLEEKVKNRTSELEVNNRQLLTKNSKLANYAYYNAHKVRAPLANVMGLTNLFINPEISAKEKEFIANKIIECSNQLNEVVFEMQQILQEE